MTSATAFPVGTVRDRTFERALEMDRRLPDHWSFDPKRDRENRRKNRSRSRKRLLAHL